jgi:hypothetical protein
VAVKNGAFGSPGSGARLHVSPLMVQGKLVADTLPSFHPGKVPVHSSLTFRSEADPAHNLRESNVLIELVPSGVL